MNITTFLKLTSFLVKSSRLPHKQKKIKDVICHNDCRGPEGNLYDIYMPSKKKVGKVVLALHGISINGKKDVRLIHFAQCLARQGIICVVPDLPGLIEGDFQINDVAVLKSLIKEISGKFNKQVGIIGFSFGASYALIAATDEELSACIEFIVAFGACYSLKKMFEDWIKRDEKQLNDDDNLNNRIYTQLFYARRYHHELGIDKKTYSDIELMLRRYCHEATIEKKKSFYFDRIFNLKLPDIAYKSYDESVLAYLSLNGKMDKVKTRVSLIHDKNDSLVLPDHSALIYEELMKKTDHSQHRLLLTSLISHVVPGSIKLDEIINLYQSLEPVFAES